MSDFRQRKAVERLQEAQAARAREDFGTAEIAAAAAVRLDPQARAGWELWADSLERQCKLIEAARVLSEALEYHGDDPVLQLSLAHAQLETGQFAHAGRVLDGLRERWPSSREPLAYVARVLRDLREFNRLRTLLERALAGPFADDAELVALRDACRGWQAERPEDRPPLTSMRERLLSEYGVVLLGTGNDDGLTIPWYATYLCSNYDVVATCARLLGFAAQFGWRWDQVAAIDPAARVLAILLAEAAEAEHVELPPPGSDPSSYPDPDRCLAVASFVQPGWGADEHGAWARACADAGGLFAFGALDYAKHPEPLPPLLGIACGERVCLPWWRLGEARIGFGRFGLIDDLPAEIDPRPPAQIVGDYRRPLAAFEQGPNFVAQLRDLLEHRAELQPGLRKRSDFARILPRVEPRPGPKQPVDDALERGEVAEFLRALDLLERAPDRIAEHEHALLERRFRTHPEVRSRLSDLLFRLDPARFATLLHGLVARPEQQTPITERDGLLHLYGCNPWTGPGGDPSRATEHLRRWFEIGAMTNRSEIVQSKYGLHHLGESDDFATILAKLFTDEPAIVLGTLRWLHDNPAHHHHAEQVLILLDHDHADVVFEAFQCARVAGLALPLARLEPFLSGHRHAHPRMISAAVEHLELSPIAESHPRLRSILADSDDPEPTIVWAAARSLLRGGESLAEQVRGAQIVADHFTAIDPNSPASRQLLRAFASADDYALFEPLLRASDSPSVIKIIAAALTPVLLDLDDPRLLEHLRRFSDAFGLDPPSGYASFLARHGDPQHDRDAVHGAQGATDVVAGYEAKAVLARWGDADAHAELERALDYAPPFSAAAFEAWFRVLHATDFERLDAARDGGDGDVLWTILRANLAGAHPAPRAWIETFVSHLRADSQRETAWASFIEQRLRAQVPSKFVVAAVSADHEVLAELLPDRFADLCARAFRGTPDRLSVDLLEWLGVHRPPQAREWAAKLAGSPHWGVRQCARRLVGSRK